MEAVIWTDVMQFFVTNGGILAILAAVLIGFHGNVGEIWNVAAQGGHTRILSFELNPYVEVTFWGLALGYFVMILGAHGSDQVVVQRFLATKSRKEMTKAALMSGLLTVPMMVALYAAGLGMAAYYRVHPALRADLHDPTKVLPHFVTHVLPTGVAGLVIAGMFAATMSSLSAGLNSLSTASIVDFYQRFRGESAVTEARDVRTAKICTLAWGLLVTVSALYMDRLGSLVEAANKVIGFFSGPLLAMFLLGILTRRTNAFGVLAGAVLGTVLTYWVSITKVSWLWYGPVGCAATIACGYVLSLLFPAPADERTHALTIWATEKAEESQLLGAGKE